MRLLLLTLLAAAPVLSRAGEVRGRVRYEGPAPAPAALETTKDRRVCGPSAPDESLLVRDGALANVVVRVVVPGAAPAPATLTLDQRGCRFVPHVQAAPVGSTLELLNGDPILHTVHAYAGARTAFDVPMPRPGDRVRRPLPQAGPLRIGCDVHGWMSAWVLVVDGPHHAVSGEDGRFSIAGVPAGTYTAIAWHERLGEREARVTVPEAGSAELELVYR
jgi:hypothetical protein